ncbi:LOW QUALITY PROTEIN: hypothetical protein PHMEG_00025924 [Phytophthora megakarya]|uniref:Tyr recombinase domain-containing protein n=1 Tax=Phytophthora megakarya TaxID=4795 RepID=A0A225VAV6_9STRA|nr:LOW QUALITY PROTEIN: hypothetical protein PHMEG_00025924 [Phytophthora megakarya]
MAPFPRSRMSPSTLGQTENRDVSHLRGAIKSAAREGGDDLSRYSTHSFRPGGVTCMYRSGVDVLIIQFHERWASDAFNLCSGCAKNQ